MSWTNLGLGSLSLTVLSGDWTVRVQQIAEVRCTDTTLYERWAYAISVSSSSELNTILYFPRYQKTYCVALGQMVKPFRCPNFIICKMMLMMLF